MICMFKEAGWKNCSCCDCETRRTMEVSPTTAAHVLGTFDVDKAREEAQAEQAKKRSKFFGLANL
jgi:hypothetical protein